MAAGHSHQAILGYTLAQFHAYLEAHQALAREQLRLQTMAMAVGSSGGEALSKWLKALAN